jgi:hypothetical protein
MTLLSLKKHLAHRFSPAFSSESAHLMCTDDDFCNNAVGLYIEDNLPILSSGKYGAKQRMECEFCN